MIDYTPTTDMVKTRYAIAHGGLRDEEEDIRAEAFERWLADHDRRVLQEFLEKRDTPKIKIETTEAQTNLIRMVEERVREETKAGIVKAIEDQMECMDVLDVGIFEAKEIATDWQPEGRQS